MQTYWLSWTYMANYSERPMRLQAETPERAVEALYHALGPDFRARATVMVYDREPVLVVRGRSGSR